MSLNFLVFDLQYFYVKALVWNGQKLSQALILKTCRLK